MIEPGDALTELLACAGTAFAAVGGAEARQGTRTRIVIRRATITDVDAVIARLHPSDAAEAAMVVKDLRRALRWAFAASLIPPKAALVDGDLAALWGLCRLAFPNTGEPWLMTGRAAGRVPLAFARIARRELAAMLAVKPRLESCVAADNTKALRLLAALGFHSDEPVTIGPKRALFRRFWIEA
jgi:hypothetical protein